jgi:hypothetical protein
MVQFTGHCTPEESDQPRAEALVFITFARQVARDQVSSVELGRCSGHRDLSEHEVAAVRSGFVSLEEQSLKA